MNEDTPIPGALSNVLLIDDERIPQWVVGCDMSLANDRNGLEADCLDRSRRANSGPRENAVPGEDEVIKRLARPAYPLWALDFD